MKDVIKTQLLRRETWLYISGVAGQFAILGLAAAGIDIDDNTVWALLSSFLALSGIGGVAHVKRGAQRAAEAWNAAQPAVRQLRSAISDIEEYSAQPAAAASAPAAQPAGESAGVHPGDTGGPQPDDDDLRGD